MTTLLGGAIDASRPTDVRWTRRPVLGWVVRACAVGGPLVVSILVAWLLTAITPVPDSVAAAIARWVAIAALSSLVLVVTERAGRRLLPIAALLDLTLVFPDRAPSRFRMALRTGTTTQLRRRIEETTTRTERDTPAEAATRVIELVAALRVHDHITRGHSERVRAYTQMIAEEMDLRQDELDRLRWAGLLHDVGKLLVPTSILNKRGRLTRDEFEIIKTHPENGRRIVEPLIPWLGDAARAVWEHHEKWDGSGYPRGLAGEEISLAARIVAVADVYDVLTSARSYMEPISPEEARAELARCAGTHFDPQVVRAFLALSIGRVRRAAGPLSWLAQLTLFPTAVFSSTQAAGGAVVLSGALGASSAGIGPGLVQETFSIVDPANAVEWVRPDARADELWMQSIPIETPPPTTTGPPSTSTVLVVGRADRAAADAGAGESAEAVGRAPAAPTGGSESDAAQPAKGGKPEEPGKSAEAGTSGKRPKATTTTIATATAPTPTTPSATPATAPTTTPTTTPTTPTTTPTTPTTTPATAPTTVPTAEPPGGSGNGSGGNKPSEPPGRGGRGGGGRP